MTDMGMFVAGIDATMIESLKKIDANKKGFLIIEDFDGKVVGTLTDGDIRRAFIKGIGVDGTISSVYTRKFQYLRKEDGLTKAIEMFKNNSIRFLPILDKNGKMTNIITKNQMHALLLQDIHADLTYEFSDLDEGIVDYEIFQRPWGFYKTAIMNDYFQSKVINVKPKAQLSLQSHNRREEHWIVAHGYGTVQIGESEIEVTRGSSLFIPKGCKHRLTNKHETENLIVIEVQIGDYFGEDDIIRYEDIYGRK